MKNLELKIAESKKDFLTGHRILEEYVNYLNLDLSFQDFQNELKNIKIIYGKPRGCLLLVYLDEKLIGCAGIREYDQQTAELKRMYIKSEFQGKGIGKKIMELAIEIAEELNYSKIRLDTLPTMKAAQHLYCLFGFHEISPYRYNPIKGTVFMEKKLNERTYKPLPIYKTKEEILEVLNSNNREEKLILLLSIGENFPDWKFVQEICLKFAESEDDEIRANAILGLAYLARTH